MKTLLLILLLAIGALVGCGPQGLTKPEPQYQSTDPRAINFRPMSIYTQCGTFTLDYPADAMGPIPAGHGRVGSTAQDLCAMHILPPSSGDADPTEADTDGGLNKAKAIYRVVDPTDTDYARLYDEWAKQYGDPTADD